MALIHSFENSGNWLFRHRGELPVVLFILAIPVVYFTPTTWLSADAQIIITIVAVFLSVLGFIIRAISIGTTPKGTSGRNTKEGQVAESLNTSGIYSLMRHPLYVGNYFMWIGIVLFTFNFSFVVIISLAFWLYYERIMFAEERFLEKKFGASYLEWSLSTPAFIPCIRGYKKNVIPFSLKSVLRREYSGMMATVTGFVFIDLLRNYFQTGSFDSNRLSVYVFGGALVVTLLLRSLKHYTTILKEEGRS
ncbi:MAG: isoprenylcysteine carboxylmethyltransferase family protein [Bacteroidetes bacterium]|jgi:protein-S-isoprenylcysteine O-methyltransferase Ste14|nr:isoprenylcysteine carboxylmethyltransferase family protein [Bacteroidota bacterium]